MPTSLAAILRTLTRRLSEAHVDAPALSVRLLACAALEMSKTQLLCHSDMLLDATQKATLEGLAERRAAGEPLAYILGKREFYGREFQVTPATLIPRPETELLVDLALERLPEAPLRFLDAGTGTGCIAVTLCAERPHWEGIMLDISSKALAVACANARQHRVSARLRAVQGDFQSLPFRGASLDLIISNPPYISAPEYAQLSPEVRDFEPRIALTPDPSGLQSLRILSRTARRLLRPGGLLLMEHGWQQAAAVREILLQSWTTVELRQDLEGRDRCCIACNTTK